MKNTLQNHLTTAAYLAMIAVAILVGTWISHHNQKEIRMVIEEQLRSTQKTMYELSVITDRNGADEIVSQTIHDCPRRGEYESYLNTLSTLTKKELLTLQSLFESCGSFYAERKALMVSKLERELKNYGELLSFRQILSETNFDTYRQSTWIELVELERNRSTLLTDQTALQEKIISFLISGTSIYSKDITSLIREAQEMSELLTVQDQRIDFLRETLTP